MTSSISRPRSSASASRSSRSVGDQRCAFLGANTVGPFRNKLRQHKPSLQRTDCRRDCQGVFGKFTRCGFREDDLVLIEIPERDDAGEDRCVTIRRLEKYVARQPARAACRQVQRRARYLERI